MIKRSEIVATARSYIGTPYHHMERQPGIALDCAGLPICIMRQFNLRGADGSVGPDYGVQPYSPLPDGKTLKEICDRLGVPIRQSEMVEGDVVLIATHMRPTHIGIVATHPIYKKPSIVHASATQRKVAEQLLVFNRVLIFVGAYRFVGVES
jgi:hypothetical protein